MEPYRRTVQYYETDKMGVVYHGNYIHWMEEARIDLLRRLGWPFDELERLGVVSPVASVEVRYRRPAAFPEVIMIDVRVERFNGVHLKLRYAMTNAGGGTVCEAASEHVFLDRDGRFYRTDKLLPEFFQALKSLEQS